MMIHHIGLPCCKRLLIAAATSTIETIACIVQVLMHTKQYILLFLNVLTYCDIKIIEEKHNTLHTPLKVVDCSKKHHTSAVSVQSMTAETTRMVYSFKPRYASVPTPIKPPMTVAYVPIWIGFVPLICKA